jgi:hypothetical protein
MSVAFGSLTLEHLPARQGFDFPYVLAVLSRQTNGDVYAWTAGSTPAAVERSFPWMSVTKFLVALAFWRQSRHAPVLSLNTPVGSPAAPGVNLVDLLSHCSGLPFDAPETAPDRPRLGVQLGISRPDARAITPFTKRIYSNYNFELAGAIAEKVMGKPWTDWVRETVLEPLGMSGTILSHSPAWGAVGPVSDLARLAGELLCPEAGVLGFTEQDLDIFCAPQHPGLRGLLPGYGPQKDNLWAAGVELHGVKSPHYLPASFPPEVFGHFGQSGSFIWVDRAAGVAGAFLGAQKFGPAHRALWPDLNAQIRELALLAQH